MDDMARTSSSMVDMGLLRTTFWLFEVDRTAFFRCISDGIVQLAGIATALRTFSVLFVFFLVSTFSQQ